MLRLVPVSVLLFTASTNKNKLLQLIYPANTVKMLVSLGHSQGSDEL